MSTILYPGAVREAVREDQQRATTIYAGATVEAVGRPTMRFVPVKTEEQLDMQSLHRVRERWIMRRTAVVNQIRGLLLERGITLRKGRCHLDAALPGILEDDTAHCGAQMRCLLAVNWKLSWRNRHPPGASWRRWIQQGAPRERSPVSVRCNPRHRATYSTMPASRRLGNG